MQIPDMRGFSFIWRSINCSWYLKSGVISTRKQSLPFRTASDAMSRFWFESFHASLQQSSEQPVWGYPPSCAVPSTSRLLDAFVSCNVLSWKLGKCYKLFAEFSYFFASNKIDCNAHKKMIANYYYVRSYNLHLSVWENLKTFIRWETGLVADSITLFYW